MSAEIPAIAVRDLNFRFTPRDPLILKDFNLELPKGARCLLVGDNGVVSVPLPV